MPRERTANPTSNATAHRPPLQTHTHAHAILHPDGRTGGRTGRGRLALSLWQTVFVSVILTQRWRERLMLQAELSKSTRTDASTHHITVHANACTHARTHSTHASALCEEGLALLWRGVDLAFDLIAHSEQTACDSETRTGENSNARGLGMCVCCHRPAHMWSVSVERLVLD